MPTYNLSAKVTCSIFTTVEAETLDDAIEEAEGRSIVLGGVGSGADEESEWVLEEADGMPENIGKA